MTKKIRVENADTSAYKVRVHLQDKIAMDGRDGNDWVTVQTVTLDYPTAMIEQCIHSGRRLIIEEAGENQS